MEFIGLNKPFRYSLNKTVPSDRWNEWDKFLPTILFSLRTRKSSCTGYTPFFLLYGFEARMVPESPLSVITPNFSAPTRENELIHLPAIRSTLKRESKSSSTVSPFKKDQLFLLLDSKLRKKQFEDKLSPRYTGPYKVAQELPHNVYQIVSELGKVKIIHKSRLVPSIMRSHEASFRVVECKDYNRTSSSYSLHLADLST